MRYRDFSGNFNVKTSPIELKVLRTGFNQIYSIFKAISKEKETQHYYLQKILEIVETGILFYAEESGEVIWINKSLKEMLHIPYLKKIDSLSSRYSDLYDEIINIRPERQGLVSVYSGEGLLKLLISASNFNTDGKR